MIKFILLFLFFLPVYATVNVQLDVNSPSVKQGEITNALLKVDGHDLKLLEGQTLAETIYVVSASETNSKIVFIKVPDSQELKGTLNGEPLHVRWNGVVVQPTEASQELIFGNFEVPARSRLMIIILLSFLVILILSLSVLIFWKKISLKKEKRNQLALLKAELLGCKNYEDVVVIWKQKQTFFKVFPEIREPFLKLEMILNLYQFKPYQSESEKEEIMKSYHNFQKEVEGGLNGI